MISVVWLSTFATRKKRDEPPANRKWCQDSLWYRDIWIYEWECENHEASLPTPLSAVDGGGDKLFGVIRLVFRSRRGRRRKRLSREKCAEAGSDFCTTFPPTVERKLLGHRKPLSCSVEWWNAVLRVKHTPAIVMIWLKLCNQPKGTERRRARRKYRVSGSSRRSGLPCPFLPITSFYVVIDTSGGGEPRVSIWWNDWTGTDKIQFANLYERLGGSFGLLNWRFRLRNGWMIRKDSSREFVIYGSRLMYGNWHRI